MTERETNIYMARVYLAQARLSRQHSNWHATLMRWAANRRRMAFHKNGNRQMEMFV